MTYVTIILSISILFIIHPAITKIYTLSLHDALPISSSKNFGQAVSIEGGSWSGGKAASHAGPAAPIAAGAHLLRGDRKSTRLNSSHSSISYAVFCLKKKKTLKF